MRKKYQNWAQKNESTKYLIRTSRTNNGEYVLKAFDVLNDEINSLVMGFGYP